MLGNKCCGRCMHNVTLAFWGGKKSHLLSSYWRRKENSSVVSHLFVDIECSWIHILFCQYHIAVFSFTEFQTAEKMGRKKIQISRILDQRNRQVGLCHIYIQKDVSFSCFKHTVQETLKSLYRFEYKN